MEASNRNPIVSILEQQTIPSVVKSGVELMVTASSSFKKFRKKEHLPLGMRVTHCPLRSDRIGVRGKHYYGKRALVNARWPEDGLHSLRTPKLAFVLEGEITFQCGDALLHCAPGHIIFIPPDVPHSDGSHTYLEETAFPQGNCKLLFIGIHAEGIAVWISITQQGSKHYSEGTSRILGRQAENYLHLLWGQSVSTERYARDNSGALLLLLLTSIYQELKEHQPLHKKAREEMRSSTSDSITRAKEYIHNHLHEKLTIDDVARHVYLSRTQFTSGFRRKTGKSFLEYLSNYRFETAKTLLLDPLNLPVNRISQRVGLQPDMLRKLFAQRVQMTPSQFRESQRKKSAKSTV